MTRRIPLARAAALIALGLCAAAVFLPPNDGPLDEWILVLRDELEGAVASNGWQTAQYSVLALSLETGDTLFAHRAREALAPASNMKLLTSAAALHHLGPDFRYRTFLLASGPIEDGRLKGDLILYGTGDPGPSDQIPGGGGAAPGARGLTARRGGARRRGGRGRRRQLLYGTAPGQRVGSPRT